MTLKSLGIALSVVASLAGAGVVIASDAAADATVSPATRAERKFFDLDLSAFYGRAAMLGAPAIMLPERQRHSFEAAQSPFAFTVPVWSQPGAFGHVLDLPPAAPTAPR